MADTSAREQILEDIKRALHREVKPGAARFEPPSNDLEGLVSGIREYCEQRRGELVQRFEAELTRIGGRFHRAATAESALQYIAQVASARRAKTIVGWDTAVIDDIGLPALFEEKRIAFARVMVDGELIRKAEAADIGISGVDYALADTGTLVLLACKGQARSISLLPPVHIAVVLPGQILSGLSDLFPILRYDAAAAGRDLSSAITFITGPSRTADIELTLVVGVHGPQELHVLVVD